MIPSRRIGDGSFSELQVTPTRAIVDFLDVEVDGDDDDEEEEAVIFKSWIVPLLESLWFVTWKTWKDEERGSIEMNSRMVETSVFASIIILSMVQMTGI